MILTHYVIGVQIGTFLLMIINVFDFRTNRCIRPQSELNLFTAHQFGDLTVSNTLSYWKIFNNM